LAHRLVEVGLWERAADGYRIHDYHDFNDTREEAIERQEVIREQRRKAGLASGKRRRTIHEHTTNGAVAPPLNTIEHISHPIPSHPIPQIQEARVAEVLAQAKTTAAAHVVVREKLADTVESVTEAALLLRAGDLLQHYKDLFVEHRRGARYHDRMHHDLEKALGLVRTWPDDARLEKLAVIVLTTDDEWISGTDRGFGVFEAKASWADDKLTSWEADNLKAH
jgi:hypothetical protein